MTELDLTELREIVEAATPGPWEAELAAKRKCTALNCDFDHWYNLVHVEGVALFKDSVLATEDALHIATFDPPTVLALIDEIERLRETLATVKAITVGTPECDKYDDKSPVTCGWKFDLQRIKEVVK